MLETLWAKPEEASALIPGDYILLGVAQAGTSAAPVYQATPTSPAAAPPLLGRAASCFSGRSCSLSSGLWRLPSPQLCWTSERQSNYIWNPLSRNSIEMNLLLYSPGPRLEKCPTNKYQLIWGLSTWFTSTPLPYRDGKGIPGQCVSSYWQAQTYFQGRVRHSHPEPLQILETARTVQRQKAKVNTKTVNEEWTQRGDILLWK